METGLQTLNAPLRLNKTLLNEYASWLGNTDWTHHISLGFGSAGNIKSPENIRALQAKVERFFWRLDNRVFGRRAGPMFLKHFVNFEDHMRCGLPTHFHGGGLVAVPDDQIDRFERYARPFWFNVNEMDDYPLIGRKKELVKMGIEFEEEALRLELNGKRGNNPFYLVRVRDEEPVKLFRYCVKFDTEHSPVARF